MAVVAALTTASARAQSLEGVKHSVGGSFNFHNYQLPLDGNADPVNAYFSGIDFLYAYSFAPSFAARVPFGLGVVQYPTLANKTILRSSTHNYAQAELDFMYKIKPKAAVSPYILVGVGAQNIVGAGGNEKDLVDAYIPVGIGLNFRVNEYWKILLEGDYRKSLTTTTDNL